MTKKSYKEETLAEKIARLKKLSHEARGNGVRYKSYEEFSKAVGLR